MALTARVGISGGRQAVNLPSDQDQIMDRLNLIPFAKGGTLMPEGPATFNVARPGVCDPFLTRVFCGFSGPPPASPPMVASTRAAPPGEPWKTSSAENPIQREAAAPLQPLPRRLRDPSHLESQSPQRCGNRPGGTCFSSPRNTKARSSTSTTTV